MKAKVINKNESVIYKGNIYNFGDEFEIDEIVGKSLIERGYIEGITDNANLFAEDEVMDVTSEYIDEMSYPQLKSYASELGLSANGKKEELVARIKEFLNGSDEAEEEVEADDFDSESDELPNTDMPE